MKRAYLRFEMTVFIKVCYVFCEQEIRRPASMQISLFIRTRVHQWSGGTDGQTDTVLIGSMITFNG